MKDEQEPEGNKPKKVKSNAKRQTDHLPKISPADKEKTRRSLIGRAEKRFEEKWLDSGLDKKNEKDRVSSFRSLSPITRLISNVLQVYGKKFEKEFYIQLFRVKGETPTPAKLRHKPWWCARRTVQLVYDRFPPAILPELRRLNPYVLDGYREHKHFQLLTDEGVAFLLKYIDDAVKVMQKANNWTHALRMMDKEHGLPFQLDMFEE